MLKKIFTSLLAITFPLFLISGCIEVQRDIVINYDGSGSEVMTMNFDKLFFDLVIGLVEQFDSTRSSNIRDTLYNDELFTLDTRKSIQERDGIKLLSLNSVTNPDSSKSIRVSYEFDNVKQLSEPVDSKAYETSSYEYEIDWLEDESQIQFRYVITPKPKTDENQSSEANDALVEEALNNKFIVFNIDLPYTIISDNSDFSNGNKLTWKIPMEKMYLQKEQVILEAVLAK